MGKKILNSKKLLIALTAMVLVAGGILFMRQYGTVSSVAEINANPSLLNGARLSGGRLDGLVLENLVLKNTSFMNMEICNFVFRNVVFEDCTFAKVQVIAGSMENVTFKGGELTYMGSPSERTNFTRFNEFKHLENLVLDDVRLDGTVFDISNGGSVYLKNLSRTSAYGSPYPIPLAIILGSNVTLRADNCQISDVALCSLDEDSTIHVSNSVLLNSGFSGSRNRATYVENCRITGTLATPQIMVVKDSLLTVGAHGGDLYFINNKFIPFVQDKETELYEISELLPSVLGGKRMFLIGNNQDGAPMPINIIGGGAYIYDSDLDKPVFVEEIDFINLRNVKIIGGKFLNLVLKAGQWENVALLPTIEIKGRKFEMGDLHFYNVTTPQGSPFKDGAKFSATVSDQPFSDWPEVKVPTMREMGIDPDRFSKN